MARLFALAALLVFAAVTFAWWGFLAWLIWHVIVVAVHDGSSGLRNGVMLAPSGSPPILPSGVSLNVPGDTPARIFGRQPLPSPSNLLLLPLWSQHRQRGDRGDRRQWRLATMFTQGAGARLTSAVQPWQPPAQVNGVSQYVPCLVPGRDSCRAGRVRRLRIRDAGEGSGLTMPSARVTAPSTAQTTTRNAD